MVDGISMVFMAVRRLLMPIPQFVLTDFHSVRAVQDPLGHRSVALACPHQPARKSIRFTRSQAWHSKGISYESDPQVDRLMSPIATWLGLMCPVIILRRRGGFKGHLLDHARNAYTFRAWLDKHTLMLQPAYIRTTLEVSETRKQQSSSTFP